MITTVLLTVLVITTVVSENISRDKPIYKVLLTQRGNPQYLRYDLRTTPLREFTICTWLRFIDLEDDQAIFSYVSAENKLIISIWVEAGGANMKIYFDGNASSHIPVSFNVQDWRHVCLSYQSDYGAWAVYVNTQLVSCEESHMLSERYFSGDGSFLIGRRELNGKAAGIQAEVFGVNMILISTINRKPISSFSYRRRPEHVELHRIKDTETKNDYVISSQKQVVPNILDEDETSYQILGQDNEYINKGINNTIGYGEQEMLDFPVEITPPPKMSKNFWDIVNKAGQEGKFKKETNTKFPIFYNDLPMISSIEIPPPPEKLKDHSFFSTQPSFTSNKMASLPSGDLLMSTKNNLDIYAIPDIETPPPVEKHPKVYGHWTGSNFAGKVLDYLKGISFKPNRKKQMIRVPPTIPLTKTSDLLPYPSDFRATFVLKPKQFDRRNDLVVRSNKVKRNPSSQQINVQILSDNRENLREKILKFHSLIKPIRVEVSNRGENNNDIEFSKKLDKVDSHLYDTSKNKVKAVHHIFRSGANQNISDTMAGNLVPAKKIKDYEIDAKDDSDFELYLKRILVGNNLRAHNFDQPYVSQERKYEETISSFTDHVADNNRRFQTVSLNHNYNITLNDNEPTGQIGESNRYEKIGKKIESFPTLDNSITWKIKKPMSDRVITFDKEDNFHKPVKIGNTLNERSVIGVSVEEKRRSFVGGNEQVPDIHRYRSDIDKEISKDIPSSLGARICLTKDKTIGSLLAQPDGNIDTKLTHDIMSQTKNVAIDFIRTVYRRCSAKGFVLENNPTLIINWLETPVQLLGGAYPQRLTSVCSFKN